MSRIDDIWDSMQQENAVLSKDVSAKLHRQSHHRPTPSDRQRLPRTLSNDPRGPEDVFARFRMRIADLDSSGPGTRKAALREMQQLMTDEMSRLSENELAVTFRDVARPLFRRMSDEVEKCRELALRLISVFFALVSDLVPYLGYFFPCVLQRLPSGIAYDEELMVFVHDYESHEAFKRGRAVDRQDKGGSNGLLTHVVVEPSEEIRLLLCQTLETLLHRLVSLGAVTVLKPYFSDLVLYLQAQLRDPFPDLKILACSLLGDLGRLSEFETGMKYYAVAIVRAVLPVLRHRHARVRVAAVKCCHSCLTVPDREKRKAAGTDALMDLVGFREENVLPVAAFYKSDVSVNYLADLVNDPSMQVREALMSMLSALLTEIDDRYDHQQRLLPYVLDLLTDDSEVVAKAAVDCLAVCGRQYEEEHVDEILERKQYGVDGDASLNLAKPLPKPFLSRPSLGIRLYVRYVTELL